MIMKQLSYVEILFDWYLCHLLKIKIRKKMKTRIYLWILISAFCFLNSCQMDERPYTSADKQAISGSEEGLKAYSISFYVMLPDAAGETTVEQSLVDYGATNSLGGFILRNAYSENNSGGWSWSALRNVNYFIENNVDPAVAESEIGRASCRGGVCEYV